MKLKPYNPGATGIFQMYHIGTVKFNATGISTGIKLNTLPANIIFKEILCKVTTAFNAASTNVLTIGTAAVADAFMGASDITEGTKGFYAKAVNKELKADQDIYVKYTQTGTAATAGKAEIYVVVIFAPEDYIHVESIAISDATASIVALATKQLTATVLPLDGDNLTVTWTSSDEDVATVSADGLVTAAAAGTCKITAKANDGGFEAICAVTVTAD